MSIIKIVPVPLLISPKFVDTFSLWALVFLDRLACTICSTALSSTPHHLHHHINSIINLVYPIVITQPCHQSGLVNPKLKMVSWSVIRSRCWLLENLSCHNGAGETPLFWHRRRPSRRRLAEIMDRLIGDLEIIPFRSRRRHRRRRFGQHRQVHHTRHQSRLWEERLLRATRRCRRP